MRCGICHKNIFASGALITNAYYLNVHKRQDHPEEMRAIEKNWRATKESNRLRKAAIASAVKAAAAQATGVVLWKWLDAAPVPMEAIEHIYTGRSDLRVAEPQWYAHYLDLAIDAAEALEAAYQQGRPITEADVERVRQAVEAVREKAEA